MILIRKIITMMVLFLSSWHAFADSVEFNTDVLDVEDRANVDLTRFADKSYVMPGDYELTVRLNQQELLTEMLSVVSNPDNEKQTYACITKDLVEKIAIKKEYLQNLQWVNDKCLNYDSLPGFTAKIDLNARVLYLNVPQMYLEFSTETWEPPSRWDNGIAGAFWDYQASYSTNTKQSSSDALSANGVAGANTGPWRFRANWQTGVAEGSKKLEWTRYYLYRLMPGIKSKLMLGEMGLDSNIFSNFEYTGANLSSDEQMIPPKLRGYASEVTGVAKTNAKVTVSQNGRVIYESQVPAGPFRIQDISEFVSGTLNVKVTEQDGSEQNYSVETANIPYLTRPGQINYKVSSGRPRETIHGMNGPYFASGEASVGINNNWSLYGGVLLSQSYQNASVGIGRDLKILGALSFDISHSRAELSSTGQTMQGKSYRLSYAKGFNDIGSYITFAGYRFSDKKYLDFSEVIDYRYNQSSISHHSKELYTISLNQQLPDLGLTGTLSYSHQTYWDGQQNNRFNASASKFINLFGINGVSFNLTGYKTDFYDKDDVGIYASLSIPMASSDTLSLSMSSYNGSISNQANYYHRLSETDSMSVGTSLDDEGNAGGNLFYSHQGSAAQVNASTNVDPSGYSSVNVNVNGGITATAKGIALHRVGTLGGSRIMIDTLGAENVPVKSNGGDVESNFFGKLVLTDVTNYYKNKIYIDTSHLPDDVDVQKSVISDTLTEGAIAYKKFDVISGRKAFVNIKYLNDTHPPFGAIIKNRLHQDVGMIGDNGDVFLMGIQPHEKMDVFSDALNICSFTLSEHIPEDIDGMSFLCTESN